MAKLDIIIPHYTEPVSLMDPQFGILRLQRNVDWGDIRVVVVCDGADINMPDGFGKNEPFQVDVIHILHGGISAARNAGLAYSNAEWIMFCDSDDAFLTTNALSTYLRFATEKKAMVASAFLEESPSPDDGHMRYLWHNGRDYIFVHGKMFRRQWLIDNNIRFNDRLFLHEDAYFVAMARLHLRDSEIGWIKDMLYLWQYNPNSVTRSYDMFVLETYDQLCKKNAALVDELLRRGMFVPAKGIVCRTITDAYCRLNSKRWNVPAYKDLVADAEDCVALFLRHYDYIFKGAGEKVIQVGLDDMRGALIKNNDFDADAVIPFEEWVERLRRH